MHEQLLDPFPGTLMVAVSGGADSTALAHLAAVRAKKRGLPMPAFAYVHHGLRPEADAELESVAAFAKSIGAPALHRRVRIPEGGGLEARAREARYAALDAMAKEWQADWILLAHTRSDQAETVFMRIVRGTGLIGLAGMAPTRGKYGRPLLGTWRKETEAYCVEHQLAFSQDAMNRDSRFTRVRARWDWLPELQRENPQVRSALTALADSAREHREAMDWAASQLLSARSKRSARGPRLDVGPGDAGQRLAEVPAAVVKRALALFLEEAGLALERPHLESLYRLAIAQTDGTKSLSLPGGQVVRSYDELFWKGEEEFATVSAPHTHAPPLVPEGYRIRRWQAGDRMRPKRLKGRSKKLSDLYAEAKVPASDRRRAWVVLRDCNNASEIVWAEHVGVAHGFVPPIGWTEPSSQVPE